MKGFDLGTDAVFRESVFNLSGDVVVHVTEPEGQQSDQDQRNRGADHAYRHNYRVPAIDEASPANDFAGLRGVIALIVFRHRCQRRSEINLDFR